jgi:hypothetical protein
MRDVIPSLYCRAHAGPPTYAYPHPHQTARRQRSRTVCSAEQTFILPRSTEVYEVRILWGVRQYRLECRQCRLRALFPRLLRNSIEKPWGRPGAGGQALGIARCREPCPAPPRPGSPHRRPRPSRAGLRLVHRGVSIRPISKRRKRCLRRSMRSRLRFRPSQPRGQ